MSEKMSLGRILRVWVRIRREVRENGMNVEWDCVTPPSRGTRLGK